MCVYRATVMGRWGAEAELHGRAAALAVSNVGDDPAAAPLELEIRDRRRAQGAAVAPVEHARADVVEPQAARRRRRPRPLLHAHQPWDPNKQANRTNAGAAPPATAARCL
jgi:hypothetical protein